MTGEVPRFQRIFRKSKFAEEITLLPTSRKLIVEHIHSEPGNKDYCGD